MLVFQINPVGVELFYHVIAFFVAINLQRCGTREWYTHRNAIRLGSALFIAFPREHQRRLRKSRRPPLIQSYPNVAIYFQVQPTTKNKASVHIHLPFCDKKCSLEKLRGKYRFQTGQAEKKINQSIIKIIATALHIYKKSFKTNFGTPQAKERWFKVLYCVNGKILKKQVLILQKSIKPLASTI